MFKQKLLLDPVPSDGGATPAPAAPVAPAAAPPIPSSGLSAQAALRLPNSPRADLDAATAKLASRQPKSTNLPEPTPAAPTPAPTPAAPAAPEPTPAAPTPAAPTPAAPAPVQKIKVGGKEYTLEELESEMARANRPAPAAQPAAPLAPQDPEFVKQQQQAANARQLREEQAWLQERQPRFEPYVAIDADAMEEIMVGGAEGAAKLQNILRQTASAAELQARKSIYAELDPVYKQLQAQVGTLLQTQERAQKEQVEARFFGTEDRAVYRQHADLCRSAAQMLADRFPNEVSNMSEAEFFGEITRQVDHHLTRQAQSFFGPGVVDWKQVVGSHSAPPAAAPAAPAPVAPPVPIPSAVSTPQSVQRPVPTPVIVKELATRGTANPAPVSVPGNPALDVQPPAANAPAGGMAFGPQEGNWHTAVNSRMRGSR